METATYLEHSELSIEFQVELGEASPWFLVRKFLWQEQIRNRAEALFAVVTGPQPVGR